VIPIPSRSQGSGCARERLVVGLAAVRIEQVLAVARGETVAAIGVLAACQAMDLRSDRVDSPRARAVHRAVRAVVPPVVADRRQDHDIAHVLDLYRSGKIPYDTALFATEES
jgi:histidine ammonia-lyase